jgi:two-component system cell cycle response regulator
MSKLSDGDLPIEPNSSAADNRASHRRRTLKRGRLVLADRSTVDCTIRDMSDGGARLVFGDAFALPESFRFMNVSENTVRLARLEWQHGREAGISFIGPEEPTLTHSL